MNSNVKNIVILGAGTGGSIVANILDKKLPAGSFNITVIDRSDTHYYQPGLLFIPFKLYGYEGKDDICKPVKDVLSDTLNFVQADITKIDHHNNIVETTSGTFRYDWLVCALGCHIAADEVEGCSERMGKDVHTFYTLPGALEFQHALEKFDKGHLVVDIAEVPIKCPVAPIEAVFLADYYFHQRGNRDNVKITLVTPYAGAFTKPNANKVLTRIAREKNINIVSEFEIEKIDYANKTINAYGGKTLDYDLLCIVPPTRGPAVIQEAGLGNDTNYGLTDHRTLRSKIADNVYFIGDNADLPTSKAGSVAHFEAETIVENLLREINGEKPLSSFDGHANCFIESGFHKALIVDFNYDIEPLPGKFPTPYAGPFSLLEDTYINHLGKLAFKWIYWYLIVNGSMPEMPFVPAHMSLVGKDLGTTSEARKTHSLLVSDLMTEKIVSVNQGVSLHEAAKLLYENDIGGMPVLNPDNKIIGIITVSDFVSGLDIETESPLDKVVAVLVKKGRSKILGSIVNDLMTNNPVTVKPAETAQTAVELMSKHNISRLIVSEDGSSVSGMLSRKDLLKIYK